MAKAMPAALMLLSVCFSLPSASIATVNVDPFLPLRRIAFAIASLVNVCAHRANGASLCRRAAQRRGDVAVNASSKVVTPSHTCFSAWT
jgi:hypothetical protein